MDFSFGQLLRIGIQMIMVVPAGGAIFGAFATMSSAPLFLLSLITTYALTLWVAIAIHELGHAAAAKLTRQRIRTISAWPIDYDVRSRTFRLSKWMITNDIGGFVSLEPDQWPTYRQHILFIIGGIAANLLASVVLFTIVNISGITDISRGVGLILTALALISLGMALGNAVPFKRSDDDLPHGKRSSAISSDGALLLDAIRTRRNTNWRRWT